MCTLDVYLCCTILLVTNCRLLLAFVPGVHYVFDTNFARNFSLIESSHEFVRRFYDSETNPKAFPMLASACPGDQTMKMEKKICFCYSAHYVRKVVRDEKRAMLIIFKSNEEIVYLTK